MRVIDDNASLFSNEVLWNVGRRPSPLSVILLMYIKKYLKTFLAVLCQGNEGDSPWFRVASHPTLPFSSLIYRIHNKKQLCWKSYLIKSLFHKFKYYVTCIRVWNWHLSLKYMYRYVAHYLMYNCYQVMPRCRQRLPWNPVHS